MGHWQHLLHLLRRIRHGEQHAEQTGNRAESIAVAICYIVVGFFFAPILVGIPVMLYGIAKLVKS